MIVEKNSKFKTVRQHMQKSNLFEEMNKENVQNLDVRQQKKAHIESYQH